MTTPTPRERARKALEQDKRGDPLDEHGRLLDALASLRAIADAPEAETVPADLVDWLRADIAAQERIRTYATSHTQWYGTSVRIEALGEVLRRIADAPEAADPLAGHLWGTWSVTR